MIRWFLLELELRTTSRFLPTTTFLTCTRGNVTLDSWLLVSENFAVHPTLSECRSSPLNLYPSPFSPPLAWRTPLNYIHTYMHVVSRYGGRPMWPFIAVSGTLPAALAPAAKSTPDHIFILTRVKLLATRARDRVLYCNLPWAALETTESFEGKISDEDGKHSATQRSSLFHRRHRHFVFCYCRRCCC